MPKTVQHGLEPSLGSDNAAWIERQTKTPEARRLYEEERLIVAMTEELAGAIADSGMTRTEVAECIGTSKANITQALRGGRNLTLRTVAGISSVTGFRISVSREPLRQGAFVGSPVTIMRQLQRPRIVHDPDQSDGTGPDCMEFLGVGGG